MRVNSVAGSTFGSATFAGGPASQHDTAPKAASSRALVPVEASADSERMPVRARRPVAPFLAHLIATDQQVPQTRARRRAEVDEVVAAYRELNKPQPAVVQAYMPSVYV